MSSDYEAWKGRYRIQNDIDAAPWPDFVFDDAALYRAFASVRAVDAELVFGKPPAVGIDQRARERALLEFCARRLPTMPIESPDAHFRPVVLEIQRLAPEQANLRLAWDGAPTDAPAMTPEELHRRAIEDIQRRLADA